MTRLLSQFSLLLIAISTSAALSADLIQELKALSRLPGYAKRVGLETEYSGVSLHKSRQILIENLHGKFHVEDDNYFYRESGRSILHKTQVTVIENSKIGGIKIKAEDNSTTLEKMAEWDEAAKQGKVSDPKDLSNIFEIVTEPISLEQIKLYDQVLRKFEAAGAVGTTRFQAVADQVNVEMGGGDPEKIKAKNIINIIKNYIRLSNRQQISRALDIPDIRKEYMGYPMRGFEMLIMNESYNPDWDRLYMDSMYRSSLESLHVEDAWTMSDDAARVKLKELVEAKGFEVLLPVLKWNFVRYSSLMMKMRPKEWLSEYLLTTGWFKAGYYIEFREPNSRFRPLSNVEWILGLIVASETYGTWTVEDLENLRLKGVLSCKRALESGRLWLTP